MSTISRSRLWTTLLTSRLKLSVRTANRRNALFGLLNFIVPSLVLFISYPLLIKHLGTERFGVYILTTTLASSIVLFDFGLASATLRCLAEDFLSGDSEQIRAVLGTSLIVYGSLGGVGACILWGLSAQLVSRFAIPHYLLRDSLVLFKLGALQLLLVLINNVLVTLSKARHRFDYSTLSSACGSVAINGLGVIAVVWCQGGLIGLMWATLIGSSLVLLLSASIAQLLLKPFAVTIWRLRFSLATLKRMLSFGLALGFHSALALFFAQLQRIVVGLWIGTSAIAIYTVAATVSSKSHGLVAACTEFLFPLTAVTTDASALRRLYWKLSIGSTLIALMILIPLAIFAQTLLPLWLDRQTAARAAAILPILCIGAVFLSMSAVPFYFLNGHGVPWLNVAFDFLSLGIAFGCLMSFSVTNRSLVNICWAYTIASVASGVLYQLSAGIFIHRRLRIGVVPLCT